MAENNHPKRNARLPEAVMDDNVLYHSLLGLASGEGFFGRHLFEMVVSRCIDGFAGNIVGVGSLSTKVHSAAQDEETNESRIATTNQVIDCMGPSLPDLRLGGCSTG
jgi:hypothetical protein